VVDKRVKAAIEPYKALSGRIDELENRFNARSKERSDPEMALLRSELAKVNMNVGKLWQHQFMVSSKSAVEESEGEIPLFDLTEELVKKKKKKGEKKDKRRRERPDNNKE
ncbi:uncharacterized protein LOC124893798, partial [Capsicum annuum]|uniref:uncharacterized protein LOC124893798 n=1 Tax=Capsicum annuum TaxID=4072 RepID=UPI001FB09033